MDTIEMIFCPDGTAVHVYSDEVRSWSDEINGEVIRVTNVKFDNRMKMWVAALIKTGEEVSIGKWRNQVTNEERDVVTDKLFENEDIIPTTQQHNK